MNKEKKWALDRIVKMCRYCDGAQMCSEPGKPLFNFAGEMDAELQLLYAQIDEGWVGDDE